MGLDVSGRASGWPSWCTPPSVIELVRAVGPIALDPCSNDASLVAARIEWSGSPLGVDGLARDWGASIRDDAGACGLVYVNPPYNEMDHWVGKMILEAIRGVEIVALVPSRTSPRWAHAIFRSAQALCFWGPGRIQFDNPPPGPRNTSSIANLFAYWGPRAKRFVSVFEKHGHCIVRPVAEPQRQLLIVGGSP